MANLIATEGNCVAVSGISTTDYDYDRCATYSRASDLEAYSGTIPSGYDSRLITVSLLNSTIIELYLRIENSSATEITSKFLSNQIEVVYEPLDATTSDYDVLSTTLTKDTRTYSGKKYYRLADTLRWNDIIKDVISSPDITEDNSITDYTINIPYEYIIVKMNE